MIIIVFGLHGHLTRWCCDVAHQVLTRAEGTAAQLEFHTLEDLAVQLLSNHPNVVMSSCRPEPSLTRTINKARTKFIFAVEEPKESVLYRIARFGETYLDATRDVLRDLATLQQLAGSPDALLMGRDAVLSDIEGQAGRILEFLGQPRDENLVRGVLEHGEANSSAMKAALIGAAADALEGDRAPASDAASRESLVIDAALSQVGLFGTADDTARILITKEFFYVDGTDGKAPLLPIDATGRARIIVYGPYISLPAGNWTVRCVHNYSKELSGNSLVVDVVAWIAGVPTELARVSFQIPSSGGVLESLLQFTIEDPRASIEVRLLTDKAIFAGEIAIGYVEIRGRNLTAPLSLEAPSSEADKA